MKSHFCNKFIFMGSISTIPLLHLIIILACLFSRVQSLCHPDESTALLEFKDSFIIRRSASGDPLAYPKIASWSPKEKLDDCCSWDGVECDENKTRVIALDLSSSCLYGSITSTSGLFRLSHLETLNLADNDFNDSLIPSQLGNLPKLTYLNLSSSSFAGQIPSEISQLSNLSYLDLSLNYDLELKLPNLSTLIRNFSDLKHLDLSYVDISSSVPSLLASFSALTYLYLLSCRLSGIFPNDIFQLPNLQFLNLAENQNLTGSFPEFLYGNPLRELSLWETGFSGHIPPSIGNLGYLRSLIVPSCELFGPVPSSLSNLSNLQHLELSMNGFSGTVNFNLFLDMKNLTFLGLAKNKLSVVITESSSIASTANETVPKFEFLLLGSCNLTSFPDFLRHQDRLKFLGLRHNQIHGKVPKWIWNTSIETFLITDNFFTGFGVDVLPSRSLRILDFSKNSFTVALPIPPPSTTYFDGSHNEQSGEISPSFYNLSSLELLDLSYNNLSGVLPECSINSNDDLSTAGDSKPYFSFGSQLQLLDLSYNQFRGYLPLSLLANCIELRVLKLENNHFNDVFPSWLGTLPKLRLLVLRSNHLHGEITRKSTSNNDFPSLQIMDLSHNNLSGLLPSHYFKKWNAMKYFDASELPYLGSMNYLTKLSGWTFKFLHPYTVSITNKGRELDYEKIEDVFRVIDLSSNKFRGDIPKCVGNLQGLQVLNLSNNILNGTIPSSLSNITQLESLDLSHNMLSGKIPQQLVQLTFLVSFDVSFNRLIGPIPQGSQFSTFDGSSYAGNRGLWGLPLPSPNTPRAPPLASGSDEEGDHDSRSWFESNWMVIVPGFVGGLIFGVAIEHVLSIDRRYWFIRALNVGIAIKNKARKGRMLIRRTT